MTINGSTATMVLRFWQNGNFRINRLLYMSLITHYVHTMTENGHWLFMDIAMLNAAVLLLCSNVYR